MPTVAKFTLEEYERMVDAGAFEPAPGVFKRRRLELLRGEIVEMSPIGTDHADIVTILTEWSYRSLNSKEGKEGRIRVQQPIRLPESHSEPEPDVAWVAPKQYRNQHPNPDEILLLIEVADSSLQEDRTEKANVYAEAGVADYWVVNLQDEQVEVFRQPGPEGYADKAIYQRGQSVAALAAPEAMLKVDELFAAGV